MTKSIIKRAPTKTTQRQEFLKDYILTRARAIHGAIDIDLVIANAKKAWDEIQ